MKTYLVYYYEGSTQTFTFARKHRDDDEAIAYSSEVMDQLDRFTMCSIYDCSQPGRMVTVAYITNKPMVAIELKNGGSVDVK